MSRLDNKKALLVQDLLETKRAQFYWTIRAYHYLSPTVKG